MCCVKRRPLYGKGVKMLWRNRRKMIGHCCIVRNFEVDQDWENGLNSGIEEC